MATYVIKEGDSFGLYDHGSDETWYLYDGNAKAYADYQPARGRVLPDYKYYTFSTTVNDNIYEGDEYFFQQFSGITGLDKWIITDEADRPKLMTSQTMNVAESEANTTLTVFINTVTPASFPYDINIRTASGTAVDGQDFVGINEIIQIPAGQNSISKTITILGDAVAEGNESLTLTASSSFGSSTTTVNIKDNDKPAVQINLNPEQQTLLEAYSEKLTDSGVSVGAAFGLSSWNTYINNLVDFAPDTGQPFLTYYDEVANNQTKVSSYSSASATVEKVSNYWSTASRAIDVATQAYVEYSTTGAIGQATERASLQVAASLISGLAGEIATEGAVLVVGGIAAGATIGVAGVALPVLAGLVVGVPVAYKANQILDSVFTYGADILYGNVKPKLATSSAAIEPASVSGLSSYIGSDGTVGGINVGARTPTPAWKYNADTKEFAWLDKASQTKFDTIVNLLSPISPVTIDGSTTTYAQTNTLLGTPGNDTIIRANKQTFVLGGYGNDLISSGTQAATSTSKAFIDGGPGNDKIWGAAGDDVLRGGNGNDILYIEKGADKLYGDAGNDVFIGQKFVSFANFDNKAVFVDGGDGIDTIDFSGTDAYALAASNAISSDFVNISNGKIPLFVTDKTPIGSFEASLVNGTIDIGYDTNSLYKTPNYVHRNITISNVENVIAPDNAAAKITGDAKDNVIRADGTSSIIFGGDGNDTLTTKGWLVELHGGNGNDSLTVGDYQAFLFGDAGNDILKGGAGDDKLDGGTGSNIIDGGAGTDTTVFMFSKAGASVSYDPAGHVIIDGLSTHDVISNVEKFQFADGSLTPWLKSPVSLGDFGLAQGWGSINNPRQLVDVDHNGSADYTAFGADRTFVSSGGTVADSQGDLGPGFIGTTSVVQDFGTKQGYTAQAQRGIADTGAGTNTAVYGQGFAGIYWYGSTGLTSQTDAASHNYSVPNYETAPHLYANFGTQQGWSTHNGFQIVKTGTTDGSTSVLGFGQDGIVVGEQAFSPTADASKSYVIPLAAGNSSGWDQLTDVRTFQDSKGGTVDLNKDGTTDFLGMGPNGTVFALGAKDTAGHYALGQLQTATFGGSSSDLGRAQGWTDQNTLRMVVHDDVTGYDNVFAFGNAGVYVAQGQDPATHGGQPLGALHQGVADFGANQGWTNDQTPRLIGDVNGDHVPDIVGFGASNTFVALGSRDAAGTLTFAVDPTKTINDFGYNQGWDSHTVRSLADVDGTGHDSLVLSGYAGTQIWHI